MRTSSAQEALDALVGELDLRPERSPATRTTEAVEIPLPVWLLREQIGLLETRDEILPTSSLSL